MTSEGHESLSEYVTLEKEFCMVFREPAIIDLVSRHTKQKIRKMKGYDYTNRQNVIQWAFVTMCSGSRKDLHPPGNRSKMSINAHISMSRWVLALVRDKIAKLKQCIHDGVTHVTPVQREWRGKSNYNITVTTHPVADVSHLKAGHILLYAERDQWKSYADRIEVTISELLRLRKVLERGFCDGDTSLRGGDR